MQVAIFGIENDALNLITTLFVLALVVIWLALIVWTYFDARRRINDPVLVACATAASLFPYIGTFVYSILRPPEFLEDARERQLEMKAAELRVRQLSELSCPNCRFPIEKSYLRCPNCQRRLKDPCENCGKPVDPRWALCPYCETPLPGRQRPRREPAKRAAASEPGKRTAASEPAKRAAPSEQPKRPPRAAPQRAASRRSQAGGRSAQRSGAPAGKRSNGEGAEGSERPAETAEQPRASRPK